MQSDTMKIHQMIDKKMRELYPGDPNKWFDGYDPRTGEIREFLDRHTEIDAYVALDDRNLSRGLEGHFVSVYPFIEDEQVSQAIEILSHQDGPYPLPDVLKTDELEVWRKKWVYESKLY